MAEREHYEVNVRGRYELGRTSVLIRCVCGWQGVSMWGHVSDEIAKQTGKVNRDE